MKRWLRDLLWTVSDRLCGLGLPPDIGDTRRRGVYRLTFELGHRIGELGWRLRARSSEDRAIVS